MLSFKKSIQCFLNRNARLVIREEVRHDRIGGRYLLSINVDMESTRMEQQIKHFDDWMKLSCLQNKKSFNKFSCEKWTQLYISRITLRNLTILVFGSLFYAKALLNNKSLGLQFVLFLHNNSSTLESFFQYFEQQTETFLS